MRLRLPLALLVAVIVAYAFYYELSSLERMGAGSFALVNVVGLAVVVFGVGAAALVLRRASLP